MEFISILSFDDRNNMDQSFASDTSVTLLVAHLIFKYCPQLIFKNNYNVFEIRFICGLADPAHFFARKK